MTSPRHQSDVTHQAATQRCQPLLGHRPCLLSHFRLVLNMVDSAEHAPLCTCTSPKLPSCCTRLCHLRGLTEACLAARRSIACRTASDLQFCWPRCLAASARLAVKLWCSSCCSAASHNLQGMLCFSSSVTSLRTSYQARTHALVRDVSRELCSALTQPAAAGHLIVLHVGSVVKVDLVLIAGAKHAVHLLLEAVYLQGHRREGANRRQHTFS